MFGSNKQRILKEVIKSGKPCCVVEERHWESPSAEWTYEKRGVLKNLFPLKTRMLQEFKEEEIM